MMLQRVFRVYLLLQIGAYPTPVAASGRQINGTASAGNYIHAEQEVDLSSAGKRSLISITSDVPVTVQRYSDKKSLVGQQPVPKNMAKVLVTSNCDTGQTQVVPDITVSSTGSYITVTLDVEEEDADAMPFLEPSSYSAFWTWITDGCGLNPTSVSPFDGDEDVTITRQERKLVSRTCGFDDATCEAGEFCQLDNELDTGACNSQGVCATMTDSCTEEYDPVCGCDGTTYSNACFAHSAGTSVSRKGECEVPPSDPAFVQDPAVTEDITTQPSCEPSETCYEEGSICATGTETCCGETHNSTECECKVNADDLLQYSCMSKDACNVPSCCQAGPPTDKPLPSDGTCDIGELCNTSIDDDYCCRDLTGGADSYCSKSGWSTSLPNDETPASDPALVQDPAVTDDITTPSSCRPSETCYEEGSTCATGTETCCGETHNSTECECKVNADDLLQYSCMSKDACNWPSCCQAGPPTDKPLSSDGTCDIGELCNTSIDDDYCCRDLTGGADSYCSKSGWSTSLPNDETPASDPALVQDPAVTEVITTPPSTAPSRNPTQSPNDRQQEQEDPDDLTGLNSAFNHSRSFSFYVAMAFMAIFVISAIFPGVGGDNNLWGLGKFAVAAMAVSSLYPKSSSVSIRKSNSKGPKPLSAVRERAPETCTYNVEVLFDGCTHPLEISAPSGRVVDVVIGDIDSTPSQDDSCVTNNMANLYFPVTNEMIVLDIEDNVIVDTLDQSESQCAL